MYLAPVCTHKQKLTYNEKKPTLLTLKIKRNDFQLLKCIVLRRNQYQHTWEIEIKSQEKQDFL
jgi:hypothetical protein